MKTDSGEMVIVIVVCVLLAATLYFKKEAGKLKQEVEEKNLLICEIVQDQNEETMRIAKLAYNNGRLVGIDVGRNGHNFNKSFESYWNSWSNR